MLVGRLFLDLPLVALCWLLIPLLWLVTLSAGSVGGRPWLTVPIAAAAGVALAAAGRSGPPLPGAGGWPRLSPLALAWALVGLLPTLTSRPASGVAALLALVAALFIADRWWGRSSRTERRVEPGAVLVVLGLLLPWFVTTDPGAGSLGWSGHGPAARFDTLAVVELVVGYTVLGYAVAEQSGRRADATRRGILLSIAATFVLANPFRLGATLPRMVLVMLAAVVGSLIYRAQRRQVIDLLTSQESAGT